MKIVNTIIGIAVVLALLNLLYQWISLIVNNIQIKRLHKQIRRGLVELKSGLDELRENINNLK